MQGVEQKNIGMDPGKGPLSRERDLYDVVVVLRERQPYN